MQEKIGKLPAEAPEETEEKMTETEALLFSIARDFSPDGWDRAAAESGSWQALKHFSRMRENLVGWLPISGKDRILEIGSDCGALTGYFSEKAAEVICIDPRENRCRINRMRCRGRENVTILAADLAQAENKLDGAFDYVILGEGFAGAERLCGEEDPCGELLRFAKAMLKPKGCIVLALENRLGLKYWAGCRDPYSDRYFGGIEQAAPGSFSREELLLLIRDSVGMQADFYYPYPDHLFPLSVYSDEYLPKKGDLKDNYCNFEGPRLQLFDEPKVYGTLIENHLFPEFANSFLVILREE